MRWALPQPFEDLGHTADLGVRVRGATAEEALARLVLALAQVLSGGGPVEAEREERIAVAGGPGLALAAVALLRELLYRFATERLVPAACEPVRLGPDGAEAIVAFGRHDPARHAEGADVKAVTLHAARFERQGEGWTAQVLLDV
jgi:SHS2 domain-containing protein